MAVTACARCLERVAASPRPHLLDPAVLTDLQRQARGIVTGLPESGAVTLAGGGTSGAVAADLRMTP